MFASGEPLDIEKTAKILLTDNETLLNALSELTDEYKKDEHGIEVLNLNGKFQFATKEKYADSIRSVLSIKKNTPLSSAAFEVLAVVAYNQPVTKAFIEQVRGVDCSGVISTLMQRNLIEEHGRLDLPGRPLLYCTTDNFLRCFEISSLDELPELPEKGGQPAAETDENGDVKGQMSLM
ncbi:MAG: SMC-Scp complex subunit ScpB [Clostridiales bacterium]|nr:SMC-Scp complex subunit ScpB [Clostridiales bacterium]MCD7828687.1 SMC-Scp complex subunit ScpB [Clostridiales bacterium]